MAMIRFYIVANIWFSCHRESIMSCGQAANIDFGVIIFWPLDVIFITNRFIDLDDPFLTMFLYSFGSSILTIKWLAPRRYDACRVVIVLEITMSPFHLPRNVWPLWIWNYKTFLYLLYDSNFIILIKETDIPSSVSRHLEDVRSQLGY